MNKPGKYYEFREGCTEAFKISMAVVLALTILVLWSCLLYRILKTGTLPTDEGVVVLSILGGVALMVPTMAAFLYGLSRVLDIYEEYKQLKDKEKADSE